LAHSGGGMDGDHPAILIDEPFDEVASQKSLERFRVDRNHSSFCS
jgi:hypothetical protein